mgnify:CR=1 FL=1
MNNNKFVLNPLLNFRFIATQWLNSTEEELAVKCGYWHNFRFNPEAESKFTLDSKAPTEDYQAFLDGEVRYNSLKRQNPEKAARLFAKNEAEAKARFEYLQKLIALHSAE